MPIRLRVILITRKRTEVLISVSSLVRLSIILIDRAVIHGHGLVISMRPVKTVLKPFEEPPVVVRAHWASFARFLLVAGQIISPHTTILHLLGLDVVLAVELEE